MENTAYLFGDRWSPGDPGIQGPNAPQLEGVSFETNHPGHKKNGPDVRAKQPEGQDGLDLLATLLILLEANKFVLATERKREFKYTYIFINNNIVQNHIFVKTNTPLSIKM